MPLTLTLTVSPAANWALDFRPPLAEQVARQIEEAEAQRAVYQAGRAYCFRCESSACEHAAPPTPQSEPLAHRLQNA